MRKTLLLGMAGLIFVFLVARGCEPGPQAVEDRLLLGELNAAEGAAYRAANRARDGVVELPDGLQVEVLQLGSGAVPAEEDLVVVHYRGEHIDGRVFEDTRRRGDPASTPVGRTIDGWRRVLLALPEGSRVRIVVPPALAYGTAGGGPIGPDETLVFELELLEVRPPPKPVERGGDQMPVPGLR